MTQVVILGGGVCGLWIRALLWQAGISTVLVSKGPLGGGQTIGSQGILHAGLKYAADGLSHEISRQLATCRDIWLSSMNRGQPLDLRNVRVLSAKTHFWTSGGMLDRAVGTAAAAVMKAGARRLPRPDFPAAFAKAPDSVGVWEVDEEVVDPASLVESLRQLPGGRILTTADEPRLVKHGRGVTIDVDGESFDAEHAVFAAGVGNESLLTAVNVDASLKCQRRPLHMLFASGVPHRVFGHCLQLSDKPRLTITTGERGGDHRGELVWYIGGEVAEKGVGRNPAQQIEAGRAEIQHALPWIDQSAFRWRTFPIDRAEGKQPSGNRPDGPVLCKGPDFTAIWPTKLAMAPAAASMVSSAILERLQVGPREPQTPSAANAAPIATPPWAGG
ncbi:MAG: FAD-dependent oxidoreductase, partial [bacterium]|nr:FAD-dependent oxidoreductase [bacterium]